MTSDLEYIKNYANNTLYIHPGQNGAYAAIASENETVLGEIEVTQRSRLAISAFYVSDKGDWSTFKITKIKYHKTHGWQEDGHVHVNYFDLSNMKELVAIIASLDLTDAKKAKIALGKIQIDQLTALLNSSEGSKLVKELANSPLLHHDIYAVATKREALAEFKRLLSENTVEPVWQSFFERNPWIFGHGLNYVFLEGVADKLETVTTGATFSEAGKRADGLMYTRAAVSQYVLIEIKRNDTDLLNSSAYRKGCWAVSSELSGAVTQTQKTVFEFSRRRFRDRLKDAEGNDLASEVYAIDPRSYLVVGNLGELHGNDDKIACFELYRRNVRSPEIITFDELYFRAQCIVENLSREVS